MVYEEKHGFEKIITCDVPIVGGKVGAGFALLKICMIGQKVLTSMGNTCGERML